MALGDKGQRPLYMPLNNKVAYSGLTAINLCFKSRTGNTESYESTPKCGVQKLRSV